MIGIAHVEGDQNADEGEHQAVVASVVVTHVHDEVVDVLVRQRGLKPSGKSGDRLAIRVSHLIELEVERTLCGKRRHPEVFIDAG